MNSGRNLPRARRIPAVPHPRVSRESAAPPPPSVPKATPLEPEQQLAFHVQTSPRANAAGSSLRRGIETHHILMSLAGVAGFMLLVGVLAMLCDLPNLAEIQYNSEVQPEIVESSEEQVWREEQEREEATRSTELKRQQERARLQHEEEQRRLAEAERILLQEEQSRLAELARQEELARLQQQEIQQVVERIQTYRLRIAQLTPIVKRLESQMNELKFDRATSNAFGGRALPGRMDFEREVAGEYRRQALALEKVKGLLAADEARLRELTGG